MDKLKAMSGVELDQAQINKLVAETSLLPEKSKVEAEGKRAKTAAGERKDTLSAFNKIITERPEVLEGFGYDPEKPETFQVAAGKLFEAVSGATGGTTKKPSIEEWMEAARKANPDSEDKELIDFYMTKYSK